MKIDFILFSLNAGIYALNSVKQKFENEDNSYKEILSYKKIVRELTEKNNEIMTGIVAYEYPNYTHSKYSTEELLGSITNDDYFVFLPEPEDLVEIEEQPSA